MIEKTLRVLFLDDDPADARLVTDSLTRAGMSVVTERVESREAFAQALLDFAPDVVLSGDALAHFDARAALEVIHDLRPQLSGGVKRGFYVGRLPDNLEALLAVQHHPQTRRTIAWSSASTMWIGSRLEPAESATLNATVPALNHNRRDP